mmetsp:Transcript_16360/g.63861  ORF Transcript_16360/g.63861 Transcript_16360/m.63861 type:complete len:230 (-) Transcript_16360:811-1500(-)
MAPPENSLVHGSVIPSPLMYVIERFSRGFVAQNESSLPSFTAMNEKSSTSWSVVSRPLSLTTPAMSLCSIAGKRTSGIRSCATSRRCSTLLGSRPRSSQWWRAQVRTALNTWSSVPLSWSVARMALTFSRLSWRKLSASRTCAECCCTYSTKFSTIELCACSSSSSLVRAGVFMTSACAKLARRSQTESSVTLFMKKSLHFSSSGRTANFLARKRRWTQCWSVTSSSSV